jgi:DNA polymerase III alpha subunit
MPDIDIDFADRSVILDKIEHRVAKLDTGKKHNTGVYVTEIPHNPVDKLSTIDYDTAEDRGYFKLDFLNVSIYKDVRDEAHLQELMTKEPLWELLEQKDFVDLVFHLSGHDSLLKQLKPTSVEQLAATLAIIRPAKRHLANETWQTILTEVWKKPTNGEYYFKKAHAVAYAVSVVVHMNLICEKVSAQSAGS